MYRILAVFSMTRYSPQILDRVMDKANHVQDPEVTVLYVTEQKDLEKLKERVGNQGFLGTFTVDRIMHSVLDEHEKLREERIRWIRHRLEENRIPYRLCEHRGEYSDCVIREVESVLYDSVFLPKPQRSFLERLFLGSEVKRVAEYTRKKKKSEINLVE